MIDDLTELLRSGGFKLTKWSSSRKDVLASVQPEKRAKNAQHLDLARDNLPGEGVHGVYWNPANDSLGFRLLVKQAPPTRRGMLSTMSSVYDPLGLVTPFTLLAKLILQNLTKMRLSWDDPVPEDLYRQWENWLGQLPILEHSTIPRALGERKEAVKYRLVIYYK